jgi:hypothetical protein
LVRADFAQSGYITQRQVNGPQWPLLRKADVAVEVVFRLFSTDAVEKVVVHRRSAPDIECASQHERTCSSQGHNPQPLGGSGSGKIDIPICYSIT